MVRVAVDRPTAVTPVEHAPREEPAPRLILPDAPPPRGPIARETVRPGQAAIDRIDGMTSGWGARRFDPEVLPDLTYEPFGLVTEKGARTIERIVRTLELGDGEIVLLRGQKKITPTVCLMKHEESDWQAEVDGELRSAAFRMKQRIEKAEHHDAIARAVGTVRSHELWKEHYRSAQPLDQLIASHKESYGIPLFVSATRNLSIAAGNYNMRTTQNDNRYIYILKVPVDRCVNIHAADHLRVQRFVAEGVADEARVETPAYCRDREAEVAVWLDATPYVAAIYDAQNDELVFRA